MGPLLAYDADGNVIHCLETLVHLDDEGRVVGLVDFEAHEAAGGKLRALCEVGGAAGSGSWPEWLGLRVHEFKVELEGKRIIALVHAESGQRRERAAIEAAIAARIEAAAGAPADIRDLVGGPGKPLHIDAKGGKA